MLVPDANGGQIGQNPTIDSCTNCARPGKTGRGVKEFVRILRLHESAPAELVEQALEQALSYGCPHLDGVKLCLEQLQVPTLPKSLLDLSNQPHLAEGGTQAVDLTCYEQLIERKVGP